MLRNQAIFEPLSVFKSIDVDSKGHLTQMDLQRYFDIKFDFGTIFEFLNEDDRRISFESFIRAVTPLEMTKP